MVGAHGVAAVVSIYGAYEAQREASRRNVCGEQRCNLAGVTSFNGVPSICRAMSTHVVCCAPSWPANRPPSGGVTMALALCGRYYPRRRYAELVAGGASEALWLYAEKMKMSLASSSASCNKIWPAICWRAPWRNKAAPLLCALSTLSNARACHGQWPARVTTLHCVMVVLEIWRRLAEAKCVLANVTLAGIKQGRTAKSSARWRFSRAA